MLSGQLQAHIILFFVSYIFPLEQLQIKHHHHGNINGIITRHNSTLFDMI